MRIIFMGTPDFSVPALVAVHDFARENGHKIIASYSQPPRRAGRGKQLRPSPVQKCAERLGIHVFHPESLKSDEAQAEFIAHQADIAVVVAYGLILPTAILDAPKLGCFNIHGSLLPRWRGAAPIHRAILAGDEQTGITIMQMDKGLDTGPMLMKAATEIDRKTTGQLHDELSELGAGLMVEVLAGLDGLQAEAQSDDGVTYAEKIAKSEARIDFTKSADVLEREVRAFAPVPGAWFELDGMRIKVLGAEIVDAQGSAGEFLDDALTLACGNGAIRLTIVQPSGKPAMPADAFLRGNPVPAGTQIS